MKRKSFKEKYQKKVKKSHGKKMKKDSSWILIVTISAFWISFILSFLSELLIPNVGFIILVLLTLLFIGIGIIFDMIGISVTVAEVKTFNSMAAKKIKGSKLASKFIKNSEKVSSFCNDVIGDICGIISGACGISISEAISKATDMNVMIITLIVTGLIASFTIGGKAIGKSIAINNANKILYMFTKTLSVFTRC
mgnify:FL=1